MRATVSRIAAAVIAGCAIGSALAGPMAQGVLAHALLVSSSPGAGEVVPVAPTELRLVFSEPVDPRYSSADVLDADGRTIQAGAGAPASDDPRTLVVPVPTLADGTYSVSWRALSGADGHLTTGFFTFGIGAVALPPTVAGGVAGGAAAGDLHQGHSAGQALLETQARTVAYLGLLLASGLAVVAWLVLRPAAMLRRGLAVTQGIALVAAAVGSVGVGLLAGSTPGLDPIGYVTGTRPGELLLLRGALGLAAGVAVLVLARLRRVEAAVAVGGAAGAAGLVLLALGGHASASSSPVPPIVLLVHLGAASIWLAGLLAVAWLVIGENSADRSWGPAVVSRFSALALVSVALVALTGAYQAWVGTRDLVDPTPYTVALWAKVGLFVVALALGAVNFLDGGRGLQRLGGLRVRLAIEALLGVAVLVATATLASGSPPAPSQPVAIAQAPTGGATRAIELGIQPGAPGPDRFIVSARDVPADATVELDLLRTDAATGGTRMPLRRTDATGDGASATATWSADGGALVADSAVDATVIVRDAAGSEIERARFPFTVGADSIVAGRRTPPVDPVMALGALALLLALLAATFVLAGGAPPRADRRLARRAVLAGSAIAAILGVMLLVGPAA